MIKLLLQNGADVLHVSPYGLTVVELSKSNILVFRLLAKPSVASPFAMAAPSTYFF